jgi:hypothetical protein
METENFKIITLNEENIRDEHHDEGHDLFVFTRERGKWFAVWRTIIP